MAYITATTKGGAEWTPVFIEAIDEEKCIGCGRCFKACSRKCLGPEDLVDEETDSTRMIMAVVNADNCSGCAACASTCPKGCFSLKPLEI